MRTDNYDARTVAEDAGIRVCRRRSVSKEESTQIESSIFAFANFRETTKRSYRSLKDDHEDEDEAIGPKVRLCTGSLSRFAVD